MNGIESKQTLIRTQKELPERSRNPRPDAQILEFLKGAERVNLSGKFIAVDLPAYE